MTGSGGADSLIASLTTGLVGVTSLLALARSLGILSRKTRLRNRIKEGREILDALPEASPARDAVERAMTRDAAILASRALVPVSPWRIALPVLLILTGYLTAAIGYVQHGPMSSLGRGAFAAGIAVIVLGEVLLANGTTRRQGLRQRKVLAIEQGRPSGRSPLDVDEVGKDVIRPRIAGDRPLRIRQRILACWRALGG